MERLIKGALGQWKLVAEALKKTDHPLYPGRKFPTEQPAAEQPKPAAAKPAPVVTSESKDIDPEAWIGNRVMNTGGVGPSSKKVNNDRLSAMFAEMNNHVAAGRHVEATQQKNAIKSHLLNSPKGSLDIGHLGELIESQHKGPNGKQFTDNDGAEMVNHHAADIKSLKDFHKEHGEKGLRALFHIAGANGAQRQYHHLNLKPGINEDINELSGNRWKSTEDRQALGLSPNSEYAQTPASPQHDKNVQDTYSDIDWDKWGDPSGDPSVKNHEKAVVDRAMDIFKRHHGIN